jgi:alpha-mannosidase
VVTVARPAGRATPAAPAGPLSVEGAPNVTLSALKPFGNPLAAGRRGTPADAGGRLVTVRLRETDGRPALARLRMAGGIEAAWLTDLLEELAEGDGPELAARDGAVSVPLAPFETVTVAVRPSAAAPRPAAAAALPEPALPEPAQPVYARYWLHGKGPAPAGNVPVAVHFAPTRITLNGDSSQGRVTLTVACGPEPASGTVELVVPGELTAEIDGAPADGSPDGGALRYDLPANGFASWDVAARTAAGTAGGRYFITARISDRLGQVLEDTALVTVGEAGGPDASLEPEELFFRLQSDVMALAGEADLELLTPELRLTPGGAGQLTVRVTSHLGSRLRGEVQLVSPVGTWPTTGPWTQSVEVAPGGEATVSFDVAVPATAEPGWESWLLVKLMYFGRVRYSPAISLTVA